MARKVYPCIDAGSGTSCRGNFIRAKRFGLEGHLCNSHYGHRHDAMQRAERAANGIPCGRCGTKDGLIKPGCVVPVRYRGPNGVRLCQACKWPEPRWCGGRPEAGQFASVSPPTPHEIRLCKLSILSERTRVRRGDEREAVRYERLERGPAGLTPAEGARKAIQEYRAATGTGGRS